MISLFRRIRQNLLLREKTEKPSSPAGRYFKYAIGELLLVVIGILIALQLNNWNEDRKRRLRFEFSLQELYTSIQSNVFLQDRLIDIVDFQIARIDSLLNHIKEIPKHRIPGMILLLDISGLPEEGFSWDLNTLDFDLNDPESVALSKALIKINDTYGIYGSGLRYLELNDAMLKLFKKHNLPVLYYSRGTTLNHYIDLYASSFYEPAINKNIESLLNDEALWANLKSIRKIKENVVEYSAVIASGGNRFLDHLRQFTPGSDFSIKRMEIVGTGTFYRDFANGIPMKKISEDGTEWEIELELQEGNIKFRTGADWVLDWGRSEDDFSKLVFRGGNIPVSEGTYKVRLNIEDNFYSLTPIGKN